MKPEIRIFIRNEEAAHRRDGELACDGEVILHSAELPRVSSSDTAEKGLSWLGDDGEACEFITHVPNRVVRVHLR